MDAAMGSFIADLAQPEDRQAARLRDGEDGLMPRPGRIPWIAIDATIRKNAKLAGLPSDAARWGWIAILGEAKLQRPEGMFSNRSHFLEAAGRFGKFHDAYEDAGLLEHGDGMCERCAPRWPSVHEIALIVHDWHLHQRDPNSAERIHDWRIERGLNSDRTLIERGLNADRTISSRARAVTETETETNSYNPPTPLETPRQRNTRLLLEETETKRARIEAAPQPSFSEAIPRGVAFKAGDKP